MPGKIWKIRLGHLTVKFVFRHKWDSPEDSYVNDFEYKTKQLGFFYKRQLAVGTKYKGRALFKKGNLFPVHMIGMHLVYAKCWIELSWRVRTFTTTKPTNTKPHIPEYGC
jgi:hypothetical protein